MSDLLNVIIITPEKDIIAKITEPHQCDVFIFSKDFCQGNFKQAIKNFNNIQDISPQSKNNLFPYFYGLVIIDFAHQKIRSMQNFGLVGMRKLFDRKKDNIIDKQIKDNLQNNLLSLYNLTTKEKYRLSDVFQTEDISKINHSERLTCLSNFQDSLNLRQKNVLDFVYLPTVNNFEYQNYCKDRYDYIGFIQSLYIDGIELTSEEQQKWINYAKNDDDYPNEYKRVKDELEKLELNKNLKKELSYSSNIIKQNKI